LCQAPDVPLAIASGGLAQIPSGELVDCAISYSKSAFMFRGLCATAALLSILPLAAQACDLCGCYTPQLETMNAPAANQPMSDSFLHGLYGAIAGQFTHFATVQIDGREVPNTTDQYLNSAITQLVAGYNITSRFALQLNVPYIYREFRRPEGFAIESGNVAGPGDFSLLGKAVLFHYASAARREFDVSGKNPVAIEREPDLTASLVGLAGIKFPTGATGRLKEEFHESEIPGAPVSGIHGHDLTLGTGSYDGIFGAQASLRYKNCFAELNGQFTWRGQGAHDYRFANDLTWSAGPGYYLVRRRDVLVGCQCAVTGEHKDVDTFRGQPAQDTGITSVFVGPRVVASYDHFSGEVAAEFPVFIDNTALQVVPDYRLRASVALSW
jgi:hypothetical protein